MLTQEAAHEEAMQALRAEHAAHVSQLRAEYEARARELTADYDRRTEVLVAAQTDRSMGVKPQMHTGVCKRCERH